MANIKSSAKRALISERNRLRNKVVKSSVKTVVRKLTDQVKADANDENVTVLLNECYSSIDKAVSKGVYHKNTAARKKSRLQNYVKTAKLAKENVK